MTLASGPFDERPGERCRRGGLIQFIAFGGTARSRTRLPASRSVLVSRTPVEQEEAMRSKLTAMMVAAAIATLGAAAAPAQQTGNDTGTATETQERRSEGQTNEFPWDLLGLLGLAGLLGLRRRDTDHSSPR